MRKGMMNIQAFIFLISFLGWGSPASTQEILHEKIFAHTDRNYYQTGELIWFSLYNVNSNKVVPSVVSKLAYVELLDSANKPVLQAKIRLDSGRGTGSFYIPAYVATGIYTFRSYTNWMKNFGAESFFHKELAIVNAANGQRTYRLSAGTPGAGNDKQTLKIQVQPDKTVYGNRQKVKLTISSTASADLSIGVYRLDSVTGEDPSGIGMLAGGDNNINDPGSFPFPPEYKGHFVNGRMISRNTRMPSKNVTGYLSVMDDANSFFNSRTDKEGRIKFLITKLNSADSIVVQTHSLYDRDQQIEIESPFFDQYAGKKTSLFSPTDEFPATVLEQSINAQVNQLYYENQLNRFRIIKNDSAPFYGKEDMHYLLDDFTRFSKLEDIFREYIRPVGVTKRQGSFHLTVFNETNRYIIDQEPLVLVDAVPVFDMNTLFTYDPLKVKTIDIVQDKYFRSGAVFPGIISLTTYRGRTDGQMIDPNAMVLGYEIVQKRRSFFSPVYENGGSANLPDFRSTLYWNPSLHTDTSGNAVVEFYTSDLDGEFLISVQGMAPGKTGSARVRVNVK